ncbi:MAG: hypothetical protein H7Y20_18235 [Bryobacteraceae bacterium]|nr:hypothetical protein [Bryobacteraceae bacterium]
MLCSTHLAGYTLTDAASVAVPGTVVLVSKPLPKKRQTLRNFQFKLRPGYKSIPEALPFAYNIRKNMANFVLNGKNVSNGQRISSPVQQMMIMGLWGPLNTFVSPSQELTLEASPSDAAKIKRSILPIQGNVRKWEITGVKPIEVTINAKAGSSTWATFVLDVKPSGWKFLSPEKQKFIEDLAKMGKPIASQFGYPLSAMLACGCSESLHGTSKIYLRTKNPFNLQKPAHWEYPKCETESLDTINKVGDKEAKAASFCIAKDLGDAARQWCEWIKYYPRETARDQLTKFTGTPKTFAEKLFLVGFADNKEEKTKEFGIVWQQFELGRFD